MSKKPAKAKPAPAPQSTAVAVVAPRAPREINISSDAVPLLDTARFEQMQRVAVVMATAGLMPDTLAKDCSRDELIARCFLIVNQATRWGMDPFAVAQVTSVIHGKLMYEGKLVAAVLDAKLGLRLASKYTGNPDNNTYGIEMWNPDNPDEIVRGTVADWTPNKSSKDNAGDSAWAAKKNWPRMLRYRGTREWTRFYRSALMLGVYTDDEMEDMYFDVRSRRAATVAPVVTSGLASRLAPPETRGGFNDANVNREMNGGGDGGEGNGDGKVRDHGRGNRKRSDDDKAMAGGAGDAGENRDGKEEAATQGGEAATATAELTADDKQVVADLAETLATVTTLKELQATIDMSTQTFERLSPAGRAAFQAKIDTKRVKIEKAMKRK